LRRQGVDPESVTTDELATYRAAARDLRRADRHRPRPPPRHQSGPRIRICRFGVESGRCRGSSLRAKTRGSSPTLPSTTRQVRGDRRTLWLSSSRSGRSSRTRRRRSAEAP